MIDSCEATRVEGVAFVQDYRRTFNATTETAVGSALGDPFVLAIGEIVDAANINQLLETENGVVAKRGRNSKQIGFADLVCQLTTD